MSREQELLFRTALWYVLAMQVLLLTFLLLLIITTPLQLPMQMQMQMQALLLLIFRTQLCCPAFPCTKIAVLPHLTMLSCPVVRDVTLLFCTT